MLNSITGFFNYIFSSDSLADAYDATIGKIPGFSKNPFRRTITSISAGQADALSEGQYDTATIMGSGQPNITESQGQTIGFIAGQSTASNDTTGNLATKVANANAIIEKDNRFNQEKKKQ